MLFETESLCVTQARLEHLGLIAAQTLECWYHRLTLGPNLLKCNLDVVPQTSHFLSFLVGQRSAVPCSVWRFLWTLGRGVIPLGAFLTTMEIIYTTVLALL